MNDSEAPHDWILRRVSTKWIDQVPGRNKLAPKELPPHAHDTSPSFLIALQPGENCAEDVGADFVGRMHKHPKYDLGQIPSGFVWVAVDADGTRYAIFYWNNWNKDTRSLCEEFAAITARNHGSLNADETVDFGSRQVPFRSLPLVHEDDLKPKAPTTHKKTAAGKKVVETARKLLTGKKTAVKELESESFNSDEAAHDDALQSRLLQKFTKRFEAHRKELAQEFGHPTKSGDERSDGDVNGVFRYAIWKINQRQLVLSAGHEDRELPYVLVLATE